MYTFDIIILKYFPLFKKNHVRSATPQGILIIFGVLGLTIPGTLVAGPYTETSAPMKDNLN